MDKDFCEKFREVLKDALRNGIVKFPEKIETQFDPVNEVYRKVQNVGKISEDDFWSQMERLANGIPQRNEPDKYDIGYYSCSFYSDIDNLRRVMRLPPKKKKIAIGTLKKEHGPILREESLHIHCWLYENAKILKDFKIFEQEVSSC